MFDCSRSRKTPARSPNFRGSGSLRPTCVGPPDHISHPVYWGARVSEEGNGNPHTLLLRPPCDGELTNCPSRRLLRPLVPEVAAPVQVVNHAGRDRRTTESGDVGSVHDARIVDAIPVARQEVRIRVVLDVHTGIQGHAHAERGHARPFHEQLPARPARRDIQRSVDPVAGTGRDVPPHPTPEACPRSSPRERPAMSEESGSGTTVVDDRVTVIIRTVAADFRTGRARNAAATVIDETIAVIIDSVAADLGRHGSAGAAGVQQAFVDRPVAVLVCHEQIADFGVGVGLAEAVAPVTGCVAELGALDAEADARTARDGRARNASTASIVDHAVAVIVGQVGAGFRGGRIDRTNAGTPGSASAGLNAGPADAGHGFGPARLDVVLDTGTGLVRRPVAVLVCHEQIADFGVGGDARTGRPEPANAELGSRRTRAHRLAARTRLAGAALAILVDRGVAVVVRTVAGFGGRADTEAKTPVTTHAVLHACGAGADVSAADAAVFVNALTVFVDGPVAVVVRAVAVLRGHDAAGTARIEQFLVDPPVAVVVETVADLARREVQRLARAVTRSIAEAEHLPLGASAEESRNHAVDRQLAVAGTVLVRPAIAVVVDAVVADFGAVPKTTRATRSETGPIAQTSLDSFAADAVHAGGTGDFLAKVARLANAAFVGFGIAVVVEPVADVRTTLRHGIAFAVAGGRVAGQPVAIHVDRAHECSATGVRTLPAETLQPERAVRIGLALGPRVDHAGIAATEAADAEHGTHAERHDPVHPVPHLVLLHLPVPPPCAAVPHAAEPPPSSEQPILSRALRRENS